MSSQQSESTDQNDSYRRSSAFMDAMTGLQEMLYMTEEDARSLLTRFDGDVHAAANHYLSGHDSSPLLEDDDEAPRVPSSAHLSVFEHYFTYACSLARWIVSTSPFRIFGSIYRFLLSWISWFMFRDDISILMYGINNRQHSIGIHDDDDDDGDDDVPSTQFRMELRDKYAGVGSSLVAGRFSEGKLVSYQRLRSLLIYQ
ncbi:hypothetical protein ACOME3_009549 [Neoechinorhynchus agilis]